MAVVNLTRQARCLLVHFLTGSSRFGNLIEARTHSRAPDYYTNFTANQIFGSSNSVADLWPAIIYLMTLFVSFRFTIRVTADVAAISNDEV